jgi:hypothetical protein
VKLEHYFLDGTKIESDANKHKVVWAKRRANYNKRVKEQNKEVLKQIELANAKEQAEYGEEDVNSELLKKKIEELNQKLWDLNRPMKKLEED